MELNENNIKEIDSHKIMELLKDHLIKLYDTYSFNALSKEEFFDIVLIEIEKSKNNYKGSINFIDYICNIVKQKLLEIIKNKLSNQDMSFKIINSFINTKMNSKEYSYEKSIKFLKQLSNFFGKYDFIPNPNVLIDLLNSNITFNKVVESVFNNKKSKIVSGNLMNLFDNDIIEMIIEIYCMINNIEITYTYNEKEILESHSSDNLKNYLNEIARYPLLNIEQEKILALKISNGDKLSRERFINCNLKLVVSVAKKYKSRSVNFMDLIEYGNIGLIEAVGKYDLNKGFRFSTYAVHWIKREILMGIKESSRNIVLPSYQLNKLKKYLDTIKILEEKLNRKPKSEEVAEEMNVDISKIREYEKLCNDTISLNEFVGEENDNELEDMVPSTLETPEDKVISDSLTDIVKSLFDNANLSDNEKKVIMYRFGFNDSERLTLSEIGNILGVSRERIRQIEAKALKKLRNTRNIKDLAIYMDSPNQAAENISTFRDNYGTSSRANKTYLKSYTRTKKEEEIVIEEKIDVITNEDYKQALNLLQLRQFKSLLNIFNLKEAIIILLSLGFVNGKKFSSLQIAKYFNLNEIEVINITRNVLISYKNYFNKLLNDFNSKEEITPKR